MTYYPVIIATLNRYEHFKRCVESLSRNTHADKTELVIGLDYPPAEKYREGYEKIKAYIPMISGFEKVTVFVHEKNFGADGNFTFLLNYVWQHYDAVIISEDDNVFSPCFLDYMNKALKYYWNDERVMGVSGFLFESFYGKISKPLLFNYDNNAWGSGAWKHKYRPIIPENYVEVIMSFSKSWKIFTVSPSILAMLTNMVRGKHIWADVSWSVLNILNNTYQLRPSYSLVRNTGLDGSGLHCGTEDPYDLAHQEISSELTFDYNFADVTSVTDIAIRKQLLFQGMPQGFFKKVKSIIVIILKYLQLKVLIKKSVRT